MTGSPRKLPCVVLGIDPGAVSGWAVMSPGELHGSGQGRLASRHALELADVVSVERQLPLVVVAERWMARMDRRRGGYTQQGLGAAWGRWQQVLEDAGHPKRRTLRVDLGTWRKGIFGGPSRRRSEEWKMLAVARANHHTADLVAMKHDEAEAICIAEFAMHWDKVRGVLPKRHLRKHGFEVAA